MPGRFEQVISDIWTHCVTTRSATLTPTEGFKIPY